MSVILSCSLIFVVVDSFDRFNIIKAACRVILNKDIGLANFLFFH